MSGERRGSDLSALLDRQAAGASKAMLGQPGWAFLANDTNGFLHYLFGLKGWDAAEASAVDAMLTQRAEAIARLGARYLRFTVPEKSAVYPEQLPEPLNRHALAPQRPGPLMARRNPGLCHYPLRELREASSFQFTYFRYDSHPNWFGAFVLYREVAAALVSAGLTDPQAVRRLSDLLPRLASYDGDLIAHMTPAQLATVGVQNDAYRSAYGLETLTEYLVPPERAQAQRLDFPPQYARVFAPRPQYRTRVADRSLPKAVIFRDSTLDFAWPLLAEHFSEALFIWHKGLVYREVIEAERPDVVLHIQAERFLQPEPQRPPFHSLLGEG